MLFKEKHKLQINEKKQVVRDVIKKITELL